MEYRSVPRTGEKVSIVGLGMGSLHRASPAEAERAVLAAIDAGVNIMDFLPSEASAFEGVSRALRKRPGAMMLQVHLGADFSSGQYGWTIDPKRAASQFQERLDCAGVECADFGFIHCIDEASDFDAVMKGGMWEYACELKERGVIRHLAFSTHDVGTARRFLATGAFDWAMFSINPLYDYTDASEYGAGEACDRAALYREFERAGVGVSVMKPFAGGQLLDARTSAFGRALTRTQCIHYALDRPGVCCVLPGIRGEADLHDVLSYLDASDEARDYSVLGGLVPQEDSGSCVYCNHCQPCPQGIAIGLANKYYDLARLGDAMAAEHYRQLDAHASGCIACGHCDGRCPFGVKQSRRMEEIAQYFGE